jgi:SAM-dependent methyltransferase
MTKLYSSDASALGLQVTGQFFGPVIRKAIARLRLPRGSSGLDAGCGTGTALSFLASAVGRNGRVTGLDCNGVHLEQARENLRKGPDSAQVVLQQGALPGWLRRRSRFDWIWSAEVLWPNYFDHPGHIVIALCHALRPGGTLAVFTAHWFRAVCLPGYPRLERLLLAANEMRWQLENVGSQRHPESMPYWLHEAGLHRIRSLPIAISSGTAALTPAARRYIEAVVLPDYAAGIREFGKRVGWTRTDEAVWRRISEPGSPQFILDQPGFQMFQTTQLSWGKR